MNKYTPNKKYKKNKKYFMIVNLDKKKRNGLKVECDFKVKNCKDIDVN